MNDPRLASEICLVTGATRGIGRAIAQALGLAGATVIGTATSEEGADTISNLLIENRISGTGMKMDVTDQQSVDSALESITRQYGAPTVLVNNAGITRDGLFLRMKEADWDLVVDTDLKSVFRMTKACLREMTRARRGRIINITSVVGMTGNAGQCNYASAKAGMLGFTRSLAQEVGSRGITVNAVAPGFIETDMTRAIRPEAREQASLRIPLGHFGSPEDVAAAVVFLASEGARYITGATIHVNGGLYMN